MFPKFSRLLACFLAFALVVALASSLKAQSSKLDAITQDELLKESPLTQSDIDLYLIFIDSNFEFFKNNPEFKEADFDAFITDFTAKNNVSPLRLKYCALKVPQVLMVLAQGDKILENMPPDMVLPISDSDKEIVDKNKEKIAASIEKNKTSE
jgi:hypothetical protein